MKRHKLDEHIRHKGARALVPQKTLQEKAQKLGYSPGDFTMAKLAADVSKLNEYIDCVANDQVHGDFTGMDIRSFRKIVRLEIADMQDREMKLMPYFYPQLKAVESNVNMSGDLTLKEILEHVGSPKDDS